MGKLKQCGGFIVRKANFSFTETRFARFSETYGFSFAETRFARFSETYGFQTACLWIWLFPMIFIQTKLNHHFSMINALLTKFCATSLYINKILLLFTNFDYIQLQTLFLSAADFAKTPPTGCCRCQ
ncbi:hypothetical protein [Neisseria yangbaofengii]|uniref:hypothetical protein n=1 Tax=Neisseria yangbaofengii TaxID=2709396 RepID=UPI0013E9BE62|nr:hypothetical protein [Neisseria yangbaofengii]